MNKAAIVLSAFLFTSAFSPANGAKKKSPVPAPVDTTFFSTLHYRNIGPYRGGRSAAVTGVPGQPELFYMGSAGGGVWKSEDGGSSWKNISDGYFGGTIGAVAVSESDPNIIFAAGGEVTVRGNVSHGYGIWKSTDAGESWKYCGLKEGQYIPRLRIHPVNPDIVYATVLGHIFGPNAERGIYRSRDGGESWEKILFVSNNAGGCDLILDPSNPRILYASTWEVRRTPWGFSSGGPGSALWKSNDGGDHWINLSENKGMPESPAGIIGVTVSPVDHNRVWAVVEAHEGGIFRSEDGGKSWQRINSDRSLRQRAWYYSRIYADPTDIDKVYVLNVSFHVSKDGGKTFSRIRTPHGDHHDLWINPDNHNIMIVADDGGAQVTFDGGQQWTNYNNQPTGQFYRVTTDNYFPYRIYAAQQDNSTVRISSRSTGYGGISENDWEPTAGGESGWIAPDPKNPDIVYGGSYGGYLVKINHRTGERRAVNVWPDNPMGWGAKDIKYRFQWNYPILFSRHNPEILYAAAQVLFRSDNGGQSWEAISPDLTRNDTTRLVASGGPITKDNTGVEYYATIFTIAESASEKGVIWTGSDDGLIHITRDNGKTWQNVTPPVSLMPEWTMINSLEADPFNPGGCYVAATAYKLDNFTPYLFRTSDYGKTWKKITRGIDPQHFTRVIRADPGRNGLLFAGTESGMYISFDGGKLWQPFQLNLPVVPVTDITLKNNDLILTTQGRGIWILDDLTYLHQLDPSVLEKPAYLFTPEPAYRIRTGGGGRDTGENPPSGPVLNFFLKDTSGVQPVTLTIKDDNGKIVRIFSSKEKNTRPGNDAVTLPLKISKGINRMVWNMQYPGAKTFPGMILWGGSTRGPLALPGNYTAVLKAGNDSALTTFTIVKDPRSSATQADLKAQFNLLIEIRDKITEAHTAIITIRDWDKRLAEIGKSLDKEKDSSLVKKVKEISGQLSEIEKALYQTKNRSNQDPLNFPIRLNNRLAALAFTIAMGDNRPTDQAYAVKDELFKLTGLQLAKYHKIKSEGIPALNRMLLDARVPFLKIPE
ncbi:MAG: glycosyl hydrolase [Chlorobi bacterium]|nr:glycosyl hydrolase [Chlorobiota bacterium]